MKNRIRKFLQHCLDRMDYLLYHNQVVIGNRPYRWCTVPVPAGYPRQSQTHPCIVYSPGGWNNYTHWLATTPYPDGDIRYENPCIYKTNVQQDTFIFSPIKQNPIVPFPGSKAFNSDPELFFHKNKLFCIVRENDNDRYLQEIKLLYSSNGEDWSNPFTICSNNDPNRHLLSPSYIKAGNKHRIYFLNGDAGIGKHGICTGIELFESEHLDTPDFKLLSKGRFTNSKDTGIEPWHFGLFSDKELLYMVLCARNKNKKTFRNPMETYLAVSEDEVNFKIFPRPLVRHLKTYRPSAYLDDQGILHLYFSVTGTFLNDGSDRNIAVTSTPFEKLLNELQKS
jgi:hypothetical protein